jgi:raffinose/stachyose/melibiose transport system substrate-binding protein
LKRKVKAILSVALSVVVIMSFAACSKSTNTASPKKVNIIFSAMDCIPSSEQKLPQNQWTISKLVSKFEQQNPDITVTIEVPADSSTEHTTFKVEALAGNAPDVANLWSGNNILQMKDALLPLDKLIPASDKSLFTNAVEVRDGLKKDGTIYAYPFISKNYGFFFYNKSLVSKAGLDFENNPPKTVSDLENDLQKIKDTGVTPIYEDNTNCQLWFYGVGLWWQQMTSADDMMAEGQGTKKFADDANMINAFTVYQDLYKKGFINTNVASAQDRNTQFYNGKAAIIADGSWDIVDAEAALGSNLGLLKFPDISDNASIKNTCTGGIGETLVVPKTAKNPAASVKLMSFLDSHDSEIALLKVLGGAPLRTDITLDELGWQNDANLKTVYAWSQKQTCLFPPALLGTTATNLIQTTTVKVLTGKMTPLQLAQLTDQAVAAAK